eukprot:a511379_386.p1 GENE.a511379_386~~a511379_386.p1  ORF type:complete len:228 (-),score=70.41 a511379_386:19-681(-)
MASFVSDKINAKKKALQNKTKVKAKQRAKAMTRSSGSGSASGSRGSGSASDLEASESSPDFETWKTGLCDLCDEQAPRALEACCCGFFAPCCSLTRSRAWLGERAMQGNDCWRAACLCACFAVPVVGQILLCCCVHDMRADIKESFQISTNGFEDGVKDTPEDCMASTFCFPCALAQHERELEIRGARVDFKSAKKGKARGKGQGKGKGKGARGKSSSRR